MQRPEYIEAEAVFESGDISSRSDADLRRYLIAICRNETGNDSVFARDIMRVGTLNQLLLTRHIENLDAASARMQKWFMFLAILSLVAAGLQVAVGWRQLSSTSAAVPAQLQMRPSRAEPQQQPVKPRH
jgi:hypothetical protein